MIKVGFRVANLLHECSVIWSLIKMPSIQGSLYCLKGLHIAKMKIAPKLSECNQS